MAVVGGYSGIVTSWAGANSHLISTGAAPASFDLSITAGEADSTAFTSSLLGTSHFPLMRSATGTIECVRPTPVGAHGASIAFSAGYITNAFEYDLTMTCAAIPSTAFGTSDTTARWLQFIPGLWQFTANWTCRTDGTTAPVSPGDATLATATFTLSSGITIAVSGFVTSQNIGVRVAGESLVRQSLRGSIGATGIALAGATNPADNATPLAIQVATELVLTTATSRTFTMDAFATSIAVRAQVDGQVTTSVGFQVTGDVTAA